MINKGRKRYSPIWWFLGKHTFFSHSFNHSKPFWHIWNFVFVWPNCSWNDTAVVLFLWGIEFILDIWTYITDNFFPSPCRRMYYVLVGLPLFTSFLCFELRDLKSYLMSSQPSRIRWQYAASKGSHRRALTTSQNRKKVI